MSKKNKIPSLKEYTFEQAAEILGCEIHWLVSAVELGVVVAIPSRQVEVEHSRLQVIAQKLGEPFPDLDPYTFRMPEDYAISQEQLIKLCEDIYPEKEKDKHLTILGAIVSLIKSGKLLMAKEVGEPRKINQNALQQLLSENFSDLTYMQKTSVDTTFSAAKKAMTKNRG